MTAQELINMAMAKIGAKATGETISTDEGTDALNAMHMLLRSWRAKLGMLYYVESGENFTLTANDGEYTIGSGGDFDTVKPVRIEGAFTRSSGLDYPIQVIGPDEYRKISEKASAGTPAYLYFEPYHGAALGTVFLWPIPSGALDFYMDSLKPLAEPTGVTSNLILAPEYDNAVVWNLAIHLAPEYGVEPTKATIHRAEESLNDLISLNMSLRHEAVKLDMPGVGRRFNPEYG